MTTALAIYILGGLADVASTRRFLRLGHKEGSAWWAAAMRKWGNTTGLVLNAVVTAIAGWLIWRYAYGPHEIIWLWIGLGRCLIATVNYTQVD